MPLPSASDADSGTQIASTARIISGQGPGRGRTTSASQSGTTAAPTVAARPPTVLVRARLRSSLSAAAHHLFLVPNGPGSPPGVLRLGDWAEAPRQAGCGDLCRPWQSTGMDDSRYLECLSADYGDLRDAAHRRRADRAGADCPGWTMADLVYHVAEVLLHKVTLMCTGEVPEQ